MRMYFMILGMVLIALLSSAVPASSYASWGEISSVEIKQCSFLGMFEGDLWKISEAKGKRGDTGEAERLFHHLVQKLIDIWLAVLGMVVDFVCSLFQSLGYRCG